MNFQKLTYPNLFRTTLIYIHRVVDYVDLAEPEREGTTEEMVDAHDHAHVEVPEDNDANFIKVQKPT